MSEGREDLEMRARWVRRLARECLDEHLKVSLQEMAADLDRRAHGNQA